MRAFLAVELPAAVRASLAKVSQTLAAARADVKWVEEANLHITIKFLGEISDAQRPHIDQLVRSVASRHPSVRLTLAGIGAFPSIRSPRVMWAGMQEGGAQVASMAEELEAGLVALGFQSEERPFAAHVTLGRVRSPKRRAELANALAHTAWRADGPVELTHLTLMQSTLTPSGSIYTPLTRVALGGGSSPTPSATPGA